MLSLLTIGAALSASAYHWGTAGWDGRDGETGASGWDGQSVEIHANGYFQSFDLAGRDGGDAGPGSRGWDASCGAQPRPHHDIVGAPGGRGGHGGDGGRGGDGGSAKVFFHQWSDLKAVQILSTPGRGGQGSWGEHGGLGCVCQDRSWKHKECHHDDHGHEHCVERTYQCQDGLHGPHGSHGGQGGWGSYGELMLVNGDSIADETLSASIPVPYADSMVVSLGRNRWLERSGARQLFAAGSDTRDDYWLFDRVIGRTFSIDWGASRPTSAFWGWSIDARLGTDFVVYPEIPQGLWLNAGLSVQGEHTKLIVSEAATAEEAAALVVGEVAGSGPALEIAIDDQSGVSDLFHTRFHVVLKTKQLLWYKKRFDDVVPTEFVRKEGDRFVLALGSLVEKAGKRLKPGKKVRLWISADRWLGENSLRWNTERLDLRVPGDEEPDAE